MIVDDDLTTMGGGADEHNAAGSVAESGDQTVEDTWQLSSSGPPARPDLDKFCSKIRTAFGEVLREFGGPDAFLRARLSTLGEMQTWLDYLGTLQDPQTVEFNVDTTLPASNLSELSQVR